MSINIKTDIPMFTAIILSLVGALASVYLNFLSSEDVRPKNISQAEWVEVQSELDSAKRDMELIRKSIEKVDSPESLQILSRIESLEDSYNSLNSLFLSEQQRAVTLPLLKGEISQQSEKIEFFSSELESLSASVQWLIALVFTSFAALIGVIVTLLMRDRGANKQNQADA